jgi:hypothetical protein
MICLYRIYRNPEIIFFKDEGRQPFEVLPDNVFGYCLQIPDACDSFELCTGRDFSGGIVCGINPAPLVVSLNVRYTVQVQNTTSFFWYDSPQKGPLAYQNAHYIPVRIMMRGRKGESDAHPGTDLSGPAGGRYRLCRNSQVFSGPAPR